MATGEQISNFNSGTVANNMQLLLADRSPRQLRSNDVFDVRSAV